MVGCGGTPSDERKLRMALTSSLYDHSAEHLAMLLVDETQWENAIATNQHYHDIWHKARHYGGADAVAGMR